MTQVTLKQMLSKEIDTLNKRIDRKILKGRAYYKDAQKHQVLVAQYRRIELRQKMNISIGSILTA